MIKNRTDKSRRAGLTNLTKTLHSVYVLEISLSNPVYDTELLEMSLSNLVEVELCTGYDLKIK